MKVIAIIPARMSSSRFPGKPMADILGMPMIGHVYKRVKMSKALDEVYIATCDKEIYSYAESIGAKAVMTKDTHERASDRCAEAMLKIEEANPADKCDIMVLVQGDEPLTHPNMIDEAVNPMLKDNSIKITNLAGEITSQFDYENPNEVKAVMDKNWNAMYFSREPIPSKKKFSGAIPMYKQVPIIPFTRDFLLEYNEMEPTPLEIIESVDMLRVLENDIKIKMIPTKYKVKAVDVPADIDVVLEMFKNDELKSRYL
ncbi:3-deoxy-manno-octulosonate cytidylyltransferase [Sulfurimonas sp. CS5]|uniref:3-deoxy-manno-octulosonate cytidylyltransferase n=1 Tax=Sulfurimonas sp. CS5 TaxID=3391145 RepID=UPI0039E89B2C